MIDETDSTSIQEYEQQLVPGHTLKRWKSFPGIYTGGHTAGTEFLKGYLQNQKTLFL